MKHFISLSLYLFSGFLIFVKVLYAGQISVINPSAGSEITGVASILPQASSSQNSSGLSTSTNINLTDEGGQNPSRYQIYETFFKRITFQSFTEDQLEAVKSQLLDVLSNDTVDDRIKDLVKKQLALVELRLQ